VAGVFPGQHAWIPLPTEGGHVTFAPTDTTERALLDVFLQRHQRVSVERILCGHIHLNAHARWCGTTVSTAPAASGMRLALDLTMTEDPAFVLDEGGFLLHHRTADGGLATHCLNARPDERRHPFHPD